MFLCERSRSTDVIFPYLEVAELLDKSNIWQILYTMKEVWKVLVREANDKRGKQKENDNDDLIKIDKECMDHYEDTNYLKVSMLVIYFHIVIGGRLSFRLKSLKLKNFQRSKAKEYILISTLLLKQTEKIKVHQTPWSTRRKRSR